MRYLHCHPINIFEKTTRFLGLLIFPVLRAAITLLLSGIDLRVWLAGAWFDIVILCVILGLGFLSWYRYVYWMDENGIHLKRGIWLVKYRTIPYEKLSVLHIEHPWYFLPFGAVRVQADTDAGSFRTPDFSIIIRKRDAEALAECCRGRFLHTGEMKKVYLPRNWYTVLLSMVASNSVTGVLFVATFITGIGQVLGKQVEKQLAQQLTHLATESAFGIPPAATALAFVVLGGWMVSFVLNLIRHLRFSVTRQGGAMDIKSGLFTRREYSIVVRRVNLIEMRQSLLTKLFGFYSVFIHANGYGKRKDELSVLMPSGEGKSLTQNLLLLLPEIPACKPKIRPHPRYISRFLIPPLIWILAVTGLWVLGMRLFPGAKEVLLYIGLMAEVPCIWYLLVKIVSYFHTGVGVGKTAYTFCYTYGYRIKTVAVPKKRIVCVTFRRSLFQVMSGCCDLVILTYSEGRKRHVVPNLDFREAKKIMGAESFWRSESEV